MEKKIRRRVNLIKSLILFMLIVCVVLANLLWYSNTQNKNEMSNNIVIIT